MESKAKKIAFIEKYLEAPNIIEIKDLSSEDKELLVESWISILSKPPEERPNKALSYWTKFNSELEQTIEYLESNLVSVDLIRHSAGLSLVYGIQANDASGIYYYEGRNPKTKTVSGKLAGVWPKIPDLLREFYDLHNGWFYLASESMGLSPCENIGFLSDDEWGILDDIGEQPINMDKTISVWSNGMGAYICLEFTNNGSLQCLIWDAKGPPKYNLEFWPVVDSWTVMGLSLIHI